MIGCPIEGVQALAYTFPTETRAGDGTLSGPVSGPLDVTLSSDATSILVVQISAGGQIGLGYACASPAAMIVVRELLAPRLRGADALATSRLTRSMDEAVRSLGGSGIVASAVAATNVALWDLKARLLNTSMWHLMGATGNHRPAKGNAYQT